MGGGIFLCVFGGLLCALSVYAAAKERRFRSTALVAEGVISGYAEGQVEHEHEGILSYSTRYFPIVEFTAEDGQEYRVTGDKGRRSPGTRGPAKVRYDPTDPTDARVGSAKWLNIVVFFALGIGMFLFGLLLAVASGE